MRILFLTQVSVYPADAGPKIKSSLVLQHLCRQHTIFYCTFIRSQAEIELLQLLLPDCQGITTIPLARSRLKDVFFFIKSLLSRCSFLLLRDEHQTMKNRVQELLLQAQIEVLHIDQLSMMQFVPPQWPGLVILDEHNAVWKVLERLRQETRNPLKRWLLGREVQYIRRAEGEVCRRAQAVLAVSESDRQALVEVAGQEATISVVPIAVDSTQYAAIRQSRAPVPGRLLTIGTLFWPSNSTGLAWWLRTGYANLQQRYPGVTYDIVGPRPPAELRWLARKYASVKLHGYIADTTPFWQQAAALAVPLRSGGGVRVKILEAMAMGVPIISTSIGCEGLEVKDGTHLLIADTPEAFAAACAHMLQDQQLAATLAHNAYRLLRERYDAPTILAMLDTIYERVANKR